MTKLRAQSLLILAQQRERVHENPAEVLKSLFQGGSIRMHMVLGFAYYEFTALWGNPYGHWVDEALTIG